MDRKHGKTCQPYAVLGACLMIGAIYAGFAYMNWERVSRQWWLDLGVATLAVFGPLTFRMRGDIKGFRAFVVLAILCIGHMGFTVHYLARGVHIRALLYIPIALVEIALGILALIVFADAQLKRYQQGE